MKTVYCVSVFCFVLCVLTSLSLGDEPKKRQKRYLRFIEGSAIFIRLNSKNNMVPEFRIFAQAIGFRVNYAAPKKLRGMRHKITRRDLYPNLEALVMHHGFDGRACVLRTLCEASKVVNSTSGILLKLFKKIFSISEGDDKYYSYLKSEECGILDGHCPFSILNLARFTDD